MRQKAKFCSWLASTASGEAIKVALEKMGRDLIEEANALEREQLLKAAGYRPGREVLVEGIRHRPPDAKNWLT